MKLKAVQVPGPLNILIDSLQPTECPLHRLMVDRHNDGGFGQRRVFQFRLRMALEKTVTIAPYQPEHKAKHGRPEPHCNPHIKEDEKRKQAELHPCAAVIRQNPEQEVTGNNGLPNHKQCQEKTTHCGGTSPGSRTLDWGCINDLSHGGSTPGGRA